MSSFGINESRQINEDCSPHEGKKTAALDVKSNVQVEIYVDDCVFDFIEVPIKLTSIN